MGPAAKVDEKTRAELKKNWTMMLAGLTKSTEGAVGQTATATTIFAGLVAPRP